MAIDFDYCIHMHPQTLMMNSYLYRILKKLKVLPQKSFVKLHYKYQTDKTLNLDDPQDFNEKIQWLKIYYKPAILTQLVDKYNVRSYVSDRAGENYLNEVYGVYERPEDIDFNGLPERFVLKATHGYDMNLVVKDKKTGCGQSRRNNEKMACYKPLLPCGDGMGIQGYKTQVDRRKIHGRKGQGLYQRL